MSTVDAITLRDFIALSLQHSAPSLSRSDALSLVDGVKSRHPEWPPLDQRRTAEQWHRWAVRYAYGPLAP